jgi:hypothetical protein
MAITSPSTRRPPPAGQGSPPGVPALVILSYAAMVYVVFLAVLGYAIGFFAGAGLPTGVDRGTRTPGPLPWRSTCCCCCCSRSSTP